MNRTSRTPQRIPNTAHEISVSAVSKPALKVIEQLTESGYQAYLVGGCVRDLLLQEKPKDFDIATDARPEDIKGVFRNCRLIGRRFRLAHVRFGRDVVEVATFRGTGADTDVDDAGRHHVTPEGQITRDNIYGELEEDVYRRDFTVNALYFDVGREQVIDYVGGVEDLKARTLRTIGEPAARFREDPVRMLRAVRFSAKLGFDIDTPAEAAINELAHLLHHVPPARMLDEVLKLFHSGHALKTFHMLRRFGLFRYMFPFTEQCLDGSGEDIPELALHNTDLRVQQGKPVIPAFLFACMLWEPLRIDAEKLMDNGMNFRGAYATATRDLFRDQVMHVAIPKRISLVAGEIWDMQQRLEQRPPRAIVDLLRQQRFRAAYDFLLLRQRVGEVHSEITDWWTRIQEVGQEEQQSMIKALVGPKPSKSGRRRRRRVAA